MIRSTRLTAAPDLAFAALGTLAPPASAQGSIRSHGVPPAPKPTDDSDQRTQVMSESDARAKERVMVKSWIAAAAVALASCGTAAGQTLAAKPSKSVWAGYGSPEDRAAIRACLDRERAVGEVSTCIGARGPSKPGNPAERPQIMTLRQLSWITIDTWEPLMSEALSWLREHGMAKEINDSQKKWEAAMLSDVGLYMDMFKDGSMSGEMARIGADIRAERTIDRVIFLEEFRAQIELNE